MSRLPTFARPCPVVLALLLIGACTSDEWPPNEPDADDDGGSSAATEVPTGARIEVFEPSSPSIHYIGEPVPLLAEVRDVDELPFPYDELVWRAEGYGPTLLVGPEGEVELPPGNYDVTATARLGDGTHLVATVGGVRVQTRWTGLYEGEASMTLAVSFQGIPLRPTCTGPVALQVGYDGQMVAAQGGSCTLNAILLTLESTYEITGNFEHGTGQGTIDYDLGGLFTLSFPWTGAFVEQGFLGSFSGTVPLPLIGDVDATGTFDAPRTSPWLPEAP